MTPILQQPILRQAGHLIHSQDPRIVGGIAGALALAAGGVWWYVASHRLSAEEIERQRREELALSGRITDGVILDARTLANEDSVSPTPEVLVYSYSVAGLTYNCAQDVSTLPNEVIGFRIDQPVQVRYHPRNPGNSIIVSETWTGLWLRPKMREWNDEGAWSETHEAGVHEAGVHEAEVHEAEQHEAEEQETEQR